MEILKKRAITQTNTIRSPSSCKKMVDQRQNRWSKLVEESNISWPAQVWRECYLVGLLERREEGLKPGEVSHQLINIINIFNFFLGWTSWNTFDALPHLVLLFVDDNDDDKDLEDSEDAHDPDQSEDFASPADHLCVLQLVHLRTNRLILHKLHSMSDNWLDGGHISRRWCVKIVEYFFTIFMVMNNY